MLSCVVRVRLSLDMTHFPINQRSRVPQSLRDWLDKVEVSYLDDMN